VEAGESKNRGAEQERYTAACSVNYCDRDNKDKGVLPIFSIYKDINIQSHPITFKFQLHSKSSHIQNRLASNPVASNHIQIPVEYVAFDFQSNPITFNFQLHSISSRIQSHLISSRIHCIQIPVAFDFQFHSCL